MCEAFSCICPEVGSIIWKLGVDSHEDLLSTTNLRDDTADPTQMTFARVEIVPANGDYRKPDRWVLKVDQTVTPTWWSPAYEASCRDAHKQWCEQLYAILDTEKVILNPFKDITPPEVITKKHIELLQQWASVWNSAWYSVWASVGDSVGYRVGASVWASVRASVRASVWASVGAQVGSLFRLPQWAENYPFQPAVDLWNLGLIPSFDGKVWRLHGGKDAAVVFEMPVASMVTK